MEVTLTLNEQARVVECEPADLLLNVLRHAGCWSVKHGCETGECGACAVLIGGRLTPTCVLLAAQGEGQSITTVESISQGHNVHPIQQAFVDSGAIQCGYCTPAMILATLALLEHNPRPSEADAREAL